MEVNEGKRLRGLEDENRRLKHLVADLTQPPASNDSGNISAGRRARARDSICRGRYPSAFGLGGTVLHRALPGGSEDFINLPARPASPEVDYSVALGTGVAGLRLVSGTLEMLDASGTPRLHVSPPYIVGADGVRTDGALAVSGCAVDSDPRGPWGRAVTAPGAATCTVRVTWPDAAVSYSVILDPRWTTTGSMGTARFEFATTGVCAAVTDLFAFTASPLLLAAPGLVIWAAVLDVACSIGTYYNPTPSSP